MGVSSPNDAHRNWVSPYPFESETGLLGVRLPVSAVSNAAQLVGTGNTLVLTNVGSVNVYVALGTGGGVQATTAHFPVLPGIQTAISLPNDGTGSIPKGLWIAVITESASGALVAHLGYGN